jgi:hypothetical protein
MGIERRQQRRMSVSESDATEEPSASHTEAEFSGEDQRDRYLERRERLRELLDKLVRDAHDPSALSSGNNSMCGRMSDRIVLTTMGQQPPHL